MDKQTQLQKLGAILLLMSKVMDKKTQLQKLGGLLMQKRWTKKFNYIN